MSMNCAFIYFRMLSLRLDDLHNTLFSPSKHFHSDFISIGEMCWRISAQMLTNSLSVSLEYQPREPGREYQMTIAGHLEILPNGLRAGTQQQRMYNGLFFQINRQLSGVFGPDRLVESKCIGVVSLEKLKELTCAEQKEPLVIELWLIQRRSCN